MLAPLKLDLMTKAIKPPSGLEPQHSFGTPKIYVPLIRWSVRFIPPAFRTDRYKRRYTYVLDREEYTVVRLTLVNLGVNTGFLRTSFI